MEGRRAFELRRQLLFARARSADELSQLKPEVGQEQFAFFGSAVTLHFGGREYTGY